MYLPFDQISPVSKIWIYQSDRPLTSEETALIRDSMKEYCENWTAHGQPLKASFDVKYNHFLVIAADETFTSTSGCSVDDSVRAVKTIEQRFGIDFFNRNLIAFLIDGVVTLIPLAKLKENFSKGMLNPLTQTFNNLVQDKAKLESEWIVPAEASWLKRYIPAPAVRS